MGKIGTNTLLEHALDGDYHSGELGNGQHGERNVADAHAHAKLSSVTANQHHLQLHKASHYPATGGDAAPFNRTATYVIAASNASALSKFGADKVCTGTADDVDINWAIEALTAAGGLVALTEGAFVLNNSILHKSLVTLEGDGPNTVIQYTDAIAGDAAIGHHDGTTYRQVIRATIRDLKIENTGTNSAKSGVAIGWDDNIPHRVVIENVEADGCNLYICCGAKHRIECCYVHSIRTGGTPQDCAIGIRGIGTTSVYDSIIAYNDVDDISDMGIFSILSDGMEIVHNHIRDVNQRNPYEIFAIDINTAINALIAENNIVSSSGINVEDCDGGTVSIETNIIRCTDNTVGIGIQVWRTAAEIGQLDRVKIDGNTVFGALWGIHVGDEDVVAIINNLLDEIGDDGIRVDKAVVGTNPTCVTINNNTIHDWAVVTEWAKAISAAVTNVHVDANTCDAAGVSNNEQGIANLLTPGSVTNNTLKNITSTELQNIELGVVVQYNPGNPYAGEKGAVTGWVKHDSANPTLGTIPQFGFVTAVHLYTIQTFNGSGTNLLTVGYDADPDSLLESIVCPVQWAKELITEAHANSGDKLGAQEDTARSIEGYYTDQNADATEGEMLIVVEYVITPWVG